MLVYPFQFKACFQIKKEAKGFDKFSLNLEFVNTTQSAHSNKSSLIVAAVLTSEEEKNHQRKIILICILC